MSLTVPEVAARLGVDPSLVRVWCRNGRLEATKHGRDWLVEESEFRHFEATRRGRGRPKSQVTR